MARTKVQVLSWIKGLPEERAAMDEECQTIRMYSFDPNWKFTYRILMKKCA